MQVDIERAAIPEDTVATVWSEAAEFEVFDDVIGVMSERKIMGF